ncbi:LacI family DNA-binding transcriptional regulator [Clostridium uliginosum]|uniref:LacI family transcriptional regulator n=1 Tax=Clostridium uliginosum TaxID=119641 RepID=A0A1I1NSM9_9CLOT|nr:LacI family DNA-binding transcriptional regulator [Clostridium uliginosum]SFD00681.1 LacI family transcriptional regulator [Clostridium uliginosum]
MSTTISDIAKKANVSLATVSRVLNNSGYVKEDTKRKVLSVIKEMNYTPSAISRSLSKSETNIIGVIVPDITNSYFGEIIKGISEICEKNNLDIILFNTNDCLDKELKSLRVAKEQRLKGVVMTPAFGEADFTTKYIKTIENLNIPIVLVSADIKFIKLNGVFVDNIKAGFDATTLLIRDGHSKIGIITGHLGSEPAVDRLIGYKKALEANNIKITEKYIFNGDFKLNKAFEITNSIFKMDEPPTALVVCSNMMVTGVVKSLFEQNKKIPEDLGVIGFGKTDFLELIGVNIPYMDEGPVELGKSAMNILLETIKEKNKSSIPVKRITIAPKVVFKQYPEK